MLSKLYLLIGVILLASCGQNNSASETNTVEKKFRVYGNCGMCEKKIEGALSGVDGVTEADWNQKTDTIVVRYNPEKLSLKSINQKIAAVGYDTDTEKANDEVYKNLHSCCQYERPNN